ncbi:pentapeptide repeat-containing protein [bacterium]|nr:pentapeptide repeat-containing protein [bacterium]
MEYTKEHIVELRDRWVHPSRYGVKIPEGMTEEKFAEEIRDKIIGIINEIAEIKNWGQEEEKLSEIQEYQKMIDFPFIEEVANSVDLRGIDLSRIEFAKGVYLWRVDLSFSNLNWVKLQNADLFRTNLQKADLQRANLQEADLYGANLQNANLFGANLQEAKLLMAKLQNAALHWANLENSNLSGTNLTNADLGWARFNGATVNSATKFIDPEKGIKKIKAEREANQKDDYTAAYEIYLKLKLLYRANGFYPEADNFLYRELVCRRKAKRQKISVATDWLFDNLFAYALKPLVVLRTAVVGIVAFALAFANCPLLSGHIFFHTGKDIFTLAEIGFLPRLWKSFYFSVVTFSTLGYGDMFPCGWAQFVVILEALFGLIAMGIFVVSLARRMMSA